MNHRIDPQQFEAALLERVNAKVNAEPESAPPWFRLDNVKADNVEVEPIGTMTRYLYSAEVELRAAGLAPVRVVVKRALVTHPSTSAAAGYTLIMEFPVGEFSDATYTHLATADRTTVDAPTHTDVLVEAVSNAVCDYLSNV